MGNSIITTEQIDAIVDKWEPGPLLDKAVAQAIDCTIGRYQMPDGRDVQALFRDGVMWIAPWGPSRNWTDAMFAAERFGDGILLTRFSLKRQHINSVWEYSLHHWDGAVFDCGKSGPTVICRAILKLYAAPLPTVMAAGSIALTTLAGLQTGACP